MCSNINLSLTNHPLFSSSISSSSVANSNNERSKAFETSSNGTIQELSIAIGLELARETQFLKHKKHDFEVKKIIYDSRTKVQESELILTFSEKNKNNEIFFNELKLNYYGHLKNTPHFIPFEKFKNFYEFPVDPSLIENRLQTLSQDIENKQKLQKLAEQGKVEEIPATPNGKIYHYQQAIKHLQNREHALSSDSAEIAIDYLKSLTIHQEKIIEENVRLIQHTTNLINVSLQAHRPNKSGDKERANKAIDFYKKDNNDFIEKINNRQIVIEHLGTFTKQIKKTSSFQLYKRHLDEDDTTDMPNLKKFKRDPQNLSIEVPKNVKEAELISTTTASPSLSQAQRTPTFTSISSSNFERPIPFTKGFTIGGSSSTCSPD